MTLQSAAKTNIAREDHNTLIDKLNEGKAVISEETSQGLPGHLSYHASPFNYVANSGLEYWPDGTSVAPYLWTLSGSGSPTISRSGGSAINLDGEYVASISFKANDNEFYQDLAVSSFFDKTVETSFKNPSIAPYAPASFAFGIWVTCADSDIKAFVEFSDASITVYESADHPGDDDWHYLTVRGIITPTGNQSSIKVGVKSENSGTVSVLVDGAGFFLGDVPWYWSINPHDLHPAHVKHKNISTTELVRLSVIETGNDEAAYVAATYLEKAVSFPGSGFKEIKSIILTPRPESGDITPSGSHQLVLHSYDVNGFTARYYGSGWSGGETMNFNWIAIGTRNS